MAIYLHWPRLAGRIGQSRHIKYMGHSGPICRNYHLCVMCYNAGMHNPSHAFVHLNRVGQVSIRLEAREGIVSTRERAHDGTTCDICSTSPIVGTRYKYGRGDESNLRGKCFEDRVHDLWHLIIWMDGEGSNKALQTRANVGVGASFSGKGDGGNMAAKNEFPGPDGGVGSAGGSVQMYGGMSTRGIKEYLRQNGISFHDVMDMDELRKQV